MSRSFFGRRRLPARILRVRTTSLAVEALEDRALLSSVPAGIVVDSRAYSASDILVSFKPGAAPLKVLPAGASLGRALPLVAGLYQVDLRSSLTVEKALAALRADPRVAFAEPDFTVHADSLPNDPSFGNLWGLNNTGQSGGVVDADIDGPEAWDVGTGSGAVTVAVIDTGVDYNHPDLAANIWTNSDEIPGNNTDDDGNGYIDDVRGWDWVNGDNDPMDDNSHGTHVAGTIGAVGNNGIGVAGVDWHVKIMPLKFLNVAGSGSTSDAVLALNYAVSKGASISSNSWGGGGYSTSLYNALNNARTKGHIFVAAAGNSSSNNDLTPFYPASYNLDNVVAVAATDRYDNLASFSNYGPTSVDLGAPGVSIYSTTPGGSYAYKSGTSMATPHVAGALALVRDLNPGLSYKDAISQVLSTVDPLPSLAGTTVSGGRLNMTRALGGIGPALPAFFVSDGSVTEGNAGTASALFTVSLTTAPSAAVTVDWATAGGTATAGSDYVAASITTLTFNPGETSKPITVAVNGDTSVEPNETFFVNLSNAFGATIGDGQGVGTILNDDIPLTFSINDVSVTEGNSGTASAQFIVSLSAPSSSTVTVNYATADGTATAGSDYVAAGITTLTFAPGDTSKPITVALNGDTALEPNETFLLNLSSPTGATIADGQGVGTILNDDLASISINSVLVMEGNTGSVNAVFTVTLSPPSPLTVTVNYATASGTAKNGTDYQPQSGTLTFSPGETSKSITVRIKGETLVEPDEAFYVNLSSPTNAILAAGQGVGTIVNDDGPGGGSLAQQAGSSSSQLDFAYTYTFGWFAPGRPARLRR